MCNPRLIKLLLSLIWGLSGMSAGLMVSIIFLLALREHGFILNVTIILAAASTISAFIVRKLARWYLIRQSESEESQS